jgi:hypothetical protein
VRILGCDLARITDGISAATDEYEQEYVYGKTGFDELECARAGLGRRSGAKTVWYIQDADLE